MSRTLYERLGGSENIKKAMEIHQVGLQEKKEVVANLYSLKGDIVRV